MFLGTMFWTAPLIMSRKHLSCLHAARSAFIQAESSERIKRAFFKNTRQTGQLFNSGDNVFYWLEGSSLAWTS